MKKKIKKVVKPIKKGVVKMTKHKEEVKVEKEVVDETQKNNVIDHALIKE